MLMAVDRILIDGRSVDASISKQIPTDDGFVATNGFVLIHSPVNLQHETNPDIALGNRLREQFLLAHTTEQDGIFRITAPFQLKKVAISLRNQCKLYQATNKYHQSFVTFTGENNAGKIICGTFNIQHLFCAFDCVGRKAVGTMYRNPEMFNGDTFMLVEPEDNRKNLAEEVNAIILPSTCPVGA